MTPSRLFNSGRPTNDASSPKTPLQFVKAELDFQDPPNKTRPKWMDEIFDLLFALAFLAAAGAGGAMIHHAIDVRNAGGKLNPETAGLMLAVKLCKAPKVYAEWWDKADFYNRFLAFGVSVAIALWGTALYYNFPK